MAKEPVPGAVKTRLCPPLTSVQAAELARAALADTFAAVAASPARRCVVALEGAIGDWVPGDVEVVRQPQASFGDRLAAAIGDSWSRHPDPVLVIGMDTPQVGPELLAAVAGRLLAGPEETVLGPAEDGGYWLIGTQRPFSGMFDEVPMSTDHTGADQLDRLRALGLGCALVPPLRDVDRMDDAAAVAAATPTTRFAATLRSFDVTRALGGSARGERAGDGALCS